MTPRRSFAKVRPLAGAIALGALAAGGAYGPATPRGGDVIIPESSLEAPADIGIRAHTNLKIFMPRGGMADARPPSFSGEVRPEESPPYAGYLYETPASLGCVYKLVSPLVPGCNPNSVTASAKMREMDNAAQLLGRRNRLAIAVADVIIDIAAHAAGQAGLEY